MKNKFLDALKGLTKLFALVIYGITYPFYYGSKYVIDMKFSIELEAEKRAKAEAEALKAAEIAKTARKKTTRKKKEVNTNIETQQ